MGVIEAAFLIGCASVVGMTFVGAWLRTEGLDPFGCAAVIFLMVLASQGVKSSPEFLKLIGLLAEGAPERIKPPWSMAHYAVFDIVLLLMIRHVWVSGREMWKPIVAILVLLEVSLHATYWLARLAGDTSLPTLRGYILMNNLAFGGVLLALFSTGVANVVRGLGVGGDHHLSGLGSVDHVPRAVR